MSESVELSRTSAVLQLRGLFLILLGCIAVWWPERTLVLAVVAAGGIAGSLGIFEIATALASKSLPSSRMFYLGHGLVFAGFGILTASAPVASVPVAMTLTVTWLLLYVVYTMLLAGRVWYRTPAREVLVAWAVLNLACAIAALRFPAHALLALFYWGALYAAVVGITQLVAGLWIDRHIISPVTGVSVTARAGASTGTERQTVI